MSFHQNLTVDQLAKRWADAVAAAGPGQTAVLHCDGGIFKAKYYEFGTVEQVRTLGRCREKDLVAAYWAIKGKGIALAA